MVGPDYVRPAITVPAGYKEVRGWKEAHPRDHVLTGKWWELFKDPQLNRLEEQVAGANQSIVQAEARYRQAQRLVQDAQAALLPGAAWSGTFNRFKAASGQSVAVAGVRNLFGTALSMAWEPDLWGGVRRQVEASASSAQAGAATLQALRLSSQAALGQYYFQLRIIDAQKALLNETLAVYQKTFDITNSHYLAGIAAKSDVQQARSQLEAIRAQAINLSIERANLEHAIAVLAGKAPAELAIKAGALDVRPPDIPVSLPSELLERRPDIAAAEREVAAANAQIGVAKAAFFPTLNLAAVNGYQSNTLDTLFAAARRYWALGPAGAALTLFEGGAKNARYKRSIDQFDASVAAYRQTVLTALQEVEDNLAGLHILDDEIKVLNQAVESSDQALALIVNQYRAGTVSYLNVLTANTAALTNRQAAVQLKGQQLVLSVMLIKALGGGWNLTLLPTPDEAGGEVKWSDYLIIPSGTF